MGTMPSTENLHTELRCAPPRSTTEKMRSESLARSHELLKNGIPAGLSGVAKRAAEAEYKVALYRRQCGML